MTEATTSFEEDLLQEQIRTVIWDPGLLWRMVRYAFPYWRRVLVGLALILVSTVLWLAPPTLVGALVDLAFMRELGPPARVVAGILSVLSGREVAEIRALPPETLLWIFGGLFLVVRLATFLVEWINGYQLMGLGQKVIYDIRVQLFRHIHGLCLAYFQRHPVGRLVTRTTNDVQALEDMFGVALVTIVKDLAMLGGIVVFLLLYNTQLALIVLTVAPFMVMATIIFRREARAAYRLWRAAISRLNAFLAEALSGIRVVQLFRKERHNDALYDEIGQEYMTHFLRQRRAWAVFRSVNASLSAAGIGLVL